MDRQKLYKILEFNRKHSKEISTAKSVFYDCIGRQTPMVIPDMQTLAQLILDNNGYKFIRIPMKSREIGAFQFRLNNSMYLVLNTSKSLANNNFAIAHELYHVLIDPSSATGNGGDLYMDNYEDNEEEQMANAFAGGIIMPAEDIKLLVSLLTDKNKLLQEIKKEQTYIQELITVFALMSYYKTTYMSVVVRCYELDIFDTKDVALMDFLLGNNSEEVQRQLFNSIPLRKGNASIMEPSREDDFAKIYEEAKQLGERNVERGLLTREDLEYRLKGMENAYLCVKEEV